MGSPRRGGNSDLLLDEFLKGVRDGGGEFEKISVRDLNISPCQGCRACKETGECVISDDMQSIYGKLLTADKIVISAPNYFYGLPAQCKALIDRCQALWARKRILRGESDSSPKEAFALLVGATGGKELFTGPLMTIRYFLESLAARLTGSLLYRKIEKLGDIKNHPTALKEAYRSGVKFGNSHLTQNL